MFPGHAGFGAGAAYSMALGIGFALAAAVPGAIDYADIRSQHPARKIATYHMVLNLLVVGLYAINTVWRLFILDATQTPLGPFLLALFAFGLLGLSGYLGGHLVYDDGIGVGRHRRRSPAPPETARPAATQSDRRPTAEGYIFVPVRKASELREGEPIRVESQNHTLSCVRDGGEFFAFQEFCTHRFGPLSEGCVKDGQVECPWHRSRFELRSGRVSEGPAKVPLKTFPTEVREGMLYVGIPRPGR
jgi:nitrite reductase/ring-hydroxylating ferredoxin subunit/uncharacterized membrane protein